MSFFLLTLYTYTANKSTFAFYEVVRRHYLGQVDECVQPYDV